MPQAYDQKLAAEFSRLSQTARDLCKELGPSEHYYHQLDTLARFGPPLDPFYQYLVGAYRAFSHLAVLQEDYTRTYRSASAYDRAYTIYRAQSIPIVREQINLLRAMIQHLPRLKHAIHKHRYAPPAFTH